METTTRSAATTTTQLTSPSACLAGQAQAICPQHAHAHGAVSHVPEPASTPTSCGMRCDRTASSAVPLSSDVDITAALC